MHFLFDLLLVGMDIVLFDRLISTVDGPQGVKRFNESTGQVVHQHHRKANCIIMVNNNKGRF